MELPCYKPLKKLIVPVRVGSLTRIDRNYCALHPSLSVNMPLLCMFLLFDRYMKEKIKSYIHLTRFDQVIFGYLLKWILITAVVGALIGSASALLLLSLNWATDYRESHLWIISLLPLAGLAIGLMYHYLAGTAAKGNNFLIEEIHSAHNIIPFKMAPLVYIGTVLTHLFGGSAGREVQAYRWEEPLLISCHAFSGCTHMTER